MTDAMADAAEAIRNASQLVLTCHVHPDGDALGSMVGFAHAARAAGKDVVATFSGPLDIPEAYRFVDTSVVVASDDVPAQPEMLVSFDAGSAERLGDLRRVADSAGTTIVIDHHITNTGFGDINVIDAEAAATAEMTLELLDLLGWPMDEVVATALLTGVVTDTGRFQYSNTTPRTLRAAARMVEAGARPEVIGQHVYEETPFGYLHVSGAVLARARLDADRRFVWAVLRREDLEAAGIGPGDVDPLIDAVRTAKESDVALLVKEVDDGTVKGSLRSRGRVDVGAIAVDLGGGGHHNAAGFTFHGTADEAVEAVRTRLVPVGG